MLQANFSTWRGHTVGMCRTLTALGVLYHNYRIINTPLPSQEGLYCMHDKECREDGGRGGEGKCECGGWVGLRGEGTHSQSALIGSDGVGTSAVQLATTAVLYRHFKGNTEYHFDISSILTILFFHTVVPSPFP